MKKINKIHVPLFWLGIVLFTFISGCGKEEPAITFTPDFDYEFVDDNHVRFINKSEGEYHLLDWDFGNGVKEASTSKSKTYEVYYPNAGDYTVKLTLVGIDGERKSTTKQLSILKTDFEVSFTALVDATNPNKVNLVNTSIGNFDSFKWLYRQKTIENESSAVAYFPYAGDYEIQLIVTKGENTFSHSKTVKITSNDPDYVANFKLVWADEFDGTSLNTNNWVYETGATGWGNNELQNYTNGNNAVVEDGKLKIIAKKVNENKTVGSYTSSRIISKGKQEFTYGRMEIRAKLPSGTGTWAALWMLGSDYQSVTWPKCGEIDIMEYVGYDPKKIHSTLHTNLNFGANGNGASKVLETAETEFHKYGLIWTEKEIKFYIDTPDNITYSYGPSNKNEDNWPFYKPQFFILNIAIGGNWGGVQGIDNSIFPQTMEIDYVHVYQPGE